MIQRIQTIFLFIAALAGLSLFLEPMNLLIGTSSESPIFADGDLDVYDISALSVVAVAGSVCALAAIFLYRNRKLQIRITLLGILNFFGLLLVSLVWFFSLPGKDPQLSSLQFSFGNLSLLLAVFACIFATRYIKKDDSLVRSMDRLR